MCAGPVAEGHDHVLDRESHTLRCACRACALLFEQGAGRHCTIPRRVLHDPERAPDPEAWDALDVPVGLAFVLFDSTVEQWVAFYPSPAGATLSGLPAGAWERLALRSRLVRALVPDVEALLIDGRRGPGAPSRLSCWLVPLDLCFDLVGRLRRLWSGFDGGDAVRDELDAFFARVHARSRPLAVSGDSGGLP
jgi:hypothetical protein